MYTKTLKIFLQFVFLISSTLTLPACGQDGPLVYAPNPNDCPICTKEAIQTSSTFYPDALPPYTEEQIKKRDCEPKFYPPGGPPLSESCG